MEDVDGQNIPGELEGRLPKSVVAEKVRKGDKIQDEGWLKLVEKVVISGNDVLLHFVSNPYEPVATYRYGHPALVYRRVEEMGDNDV